VVKPFSGRLILRPQLPKPLCLVVLLLSVCVAPAAAWQLASRDAQDWITSLDSPKRVQAQKVDEVISRLDLKPGEVVADIGAGSGLFSYPLGRAVAPGGKVYAVDIEQGLLDYIHQTAEAHNIGNIVTVLGGFDDPKLPDHDVDLAFFNDVLHHIEHRAEYIKALSGYIKPGGRIALIDMNGNDPHNGHRNQPAMLLYRKDIDQWMSAAGFHLTKEFSDLFPDGSRWFLIYSRK
jgi:ubiquinone/menaquinone biosynthesis C-methylase UbiE